MNYKQMMEAVEWSKSKEDKWNEPKLRELKHVFTVTKACIDDKAISEKGNEAVDKCVEDKLNDEISAASGTATTVIGNATAMPATVAAITTTSPAVSVSPTTPANA